VLLLSAATGEGVDELQEQIAAMLPHPEVRLTVLLPFGRGDLVARAHRECEVLAVEHLPEGTRLTLRAPPALAAALEPYVLGPGHEAAPVTPGARTPVERR